MAKQEPINSDQGASRLRAAPAAVGKRLREAFWAVEDRVVWGGRDALRRGADIVRWPFERLYWTIEKRGVWPLRERTAGWALPARAAGAGALAAVAIAAVALGAILASPGGDGGADRPSLVAAEPAATPVATDPPEPKAPEPVLRGAPPVLSANGTVATLGDAAAETGAPASSAASPQGAAGGGATASSSKAVAAGPAAMKVARRFAEAFVVYEVGEEARAEVAFAKTATPRLAGALSKRPPRLPEKAKIPQAKVVNLVPGPRRGKAYSVSVSLLRVGVTSELRLELRRNPQGWLVTDVRG